jgi:hypothetical protein
MKKFPAEVIMKVIFPEYYAAERIEEQDKKDKRKDLPPKPVGLGSVLDQRPAAKQKIFRDKKRDSAGFGCFAA